MNRFSQSMNLLYDFFKDNPSISIVNLDNLSLRKVGVQNIYKGITANRTNPLKILSIKNNAISDQASLQISLMARSGLISFDISQNPLGPKFYLSLPSWKQSTVNNLNISMTEMNSQCLIFFLSRLQENKSLRNLKVDKNDFSHHWFNQIKECLEINSSIESLSLVECKIKRVSQIFSGLYHNRYLKKVNISHNNFEQGVKQICELLKLSKVLAQLRMRFCGLKTDDFIKMFECLNNNERLVFLDISENRLGEDGAKQIMKTLSRNSVITTLITQKVQIPFNLKQEIDEKILANRGIKRAREMVSLKKENKMVKKMDIYTWKDVQDLYSKVRTNGKMIPMLEGKIKNLEIEYEKKKYRFQEIMKDYDARDQIFSQQILDMKAKIDKTEKDKCKALKIFETTENSIFTAQKAEEESIENLQRLILEQSRKNRERENYLEDEYENTKYKQKKSNSKSKQLQRMEFDPSISVISKKKNKNP